MEKNYTTQLNLINFTQAGITIATYPEIRNMIAERYKEIYGSDIDLSNNADAVFVETLSLMFSNILNTVQKLYSNLNINNADGIYLDALCALSGIYRKSATYSTAQLSLTSHESTDIVITQNNYLEFIDQGNQTWRTILQDATTITLKPNTKTIVTVQCTTPGPINATIGWINQLVNQQYDLDILQEDNCEIGSYAENDIQLRARRAESISTRSVSVLQGLNAALISLIGIEDCLIYENSSSSAKYAEDGTSVSPHSIYVVLQRNKNIEIDDSTIGSIIYEKLTPGIQTIQMNDSAVGGVSHSYVYQQYILGRLNESAIDQTVYWKECTPVTSGVTITAKIKKLNNYYSETPSKYILPAIISFMNDLGISEEFTILDLINTINNSDVAFRGQNTFNCIDASLTAEASTTTIKTTGTGVTQSYLAKDTYFNWTNATVSATEESGIITLTFKVE